MGIIGGSRHYPGGGLGNEGGWRCPSCGQENAGRIAEGCAVCGAGAPRTAPVGPPPAPTLDAIEAAAATVATARLPHARPPVDGLTPAWLAAHPDASAEQAYFAGYAAGVKAAHDANQTHAPQAPRAAEPAFTQDGKIARTIVAALQFFADQVLTQAPEEIRTGEWLSGVEVAALIAQLRAEEIVHA